MGDDRVDVLPAEAVAEAGATWIQVTGWFDQLRELAASPAPGT